MKKLYAAIAAILMALVIPAYASADFSWEFNYCPWPDFFQYPTDKPDGKYIGGIGGKTSSDKAFVFDANGEDVFSGGKYLQYQGVGTAGIELGDITTIEQNVYLSGNGKFVLGGKMTSPDAWHSYLEIDSDGTVKAANQSGALTENAKATLGQWHKTALVFNAQAAEIEIYFDQNKIGAISCTVSGRKEAYIKYTLSKNKEESVYGRMAIDNFKIYSSAYNPENDKINVKAQASDLYIDAVGKRIYYNPDIYNALASRAQEATDASRAVMIDENTLMLTAENGYTYHYFTLDDNIKNAFNHTVSPVSLIKSEGILYAECETEGNFFEAPVMYVAGYDNDGNLETVLLRKADASKSKNKLEINAAVNDGYTYKAFLWEGGNPLCAAADMIENSGRVLLNTGFESGERSASMTAKYENQLSEASENQNTFMRFTQTNPHSYHLDSYIDESRTGYGTYEADFRITDDNTDAQFCLKDSRSAEFTPFLIRGSSLYAGSSRVRTLEKNRWYKLSVSCDFTGGSYTLYMDNSRIGTYTIKNSDFAKDGYVILVRVYAGQHTESEYSSFDVDNIRAYEETEPKKHIGDFVAKTPDFDKSVFTDTGYVTRETIYGDFAENYCSHPRIQASAADFSRISAEIQTDEYMSSWYDQIISAADKCISKPNIIYSFKNSNPLLMEAKGALEDMYALCMAYRISGNEKYFIRAWAMLENICSMGDWMPTNHLTPAEMSAVVAVGYDWLYDALGKQQREFIEKAVYNNAIYDFLRAYRDQSSPMQNGMYVDMNHSVICNSGAFLTAMAFMDIYPEECSRIASEALRGINVTLYRFAPVGAWFEGPGYWEYTVQYLSKLISSAKTALGTDYNISKAQGLSSAQRYMLAMQSDKAIFNYGDASENKYLVPEIMYLADLSGDTASLSAFLNMSGGKMNNAEDVALAMLWYTKPSDDGSLLKDFYFEGEEVASMRDGWSAENQTFVGLRAGKLSETHSDLDAGSFVFDCFGMRWAKDSGSGNYDVNGYWDISENGGRWKTLAKRAEAHNTIAINPTVKNEFPVDYSAKITAFQSGENEAAAIMDLTDAQRNNAVSAKRGFWFTDNRKSLVIRDEISLKASSTLYWFMQTDADVSVSESGATLTQGGKSVKLEFVTNAEGAVISAEEIKPLFDGSVLYNNSKGNRIAIKITASGDFNITVKLTPEGVNASSINEYNIPLSVWSLSDMEEIGLKSSMAAVDVSERNVIGAYSGSVSGNIISANTLLSALSSSNGYTLSVLAEDGKTVLTSQKAGNGCYLKAVKGEKTVYVPIRENIPVGSADSNIANGNGYKVSGSSVISAEGGIGGTPSSAKSAVFTLTGNASSGDKPRIQRDGLKSDTVYTYEIEAYADGDAAAEIIESVSGKGITLFKIYADGTVMYNSDGAMKTYPEKLITENGWHKLSATFDVKRGRMHLYCDGVYLTNFTEWNMSFSGLRFAVGDGSAGSRVAYDNFNIYKGFVK